MYPNDEEVVYDEARDEFASYFNRQTSPKILVTASGRSHGRTVRLYDHLSAVIPNSHASYRRALAVKNYFTVPSQEISQADCY